MDVCFPRKDVEAAIHSACMANGVTNLKGKKAEAIASFVEGSHIFICLPTGYGKSVASPRVRPPSREEWWRLDCL